MTIEFDGQNNKLGTTNANSVTIKTNDTDALTVDSSANLQFNSGYGSVATAYGCRAWVNFNGTGTVAIRDSGNVSSITDNGIGDYTVNFTTAMPDANYTFVGSSGGAGGTSSGAVYLNDQATARTTALCRLALVTTAGSLVDTPQINVAIFR
jgi:hypothetical protein